jgi:outer membrane protein TolC
MLQAAREGVVAAEERIGPAGTLPDPQISGQLMNRAPPSFSFTSNLMTQNQLGVMQTIPFPGKQGAARNAAEHNAAAASADADEQTRMLASEVRMHYFDVAYADRALDVMRQTRGLLREFLDVSTTMYAVGSAVQQDVLRAQIEVGRMAEEITRMTQDRLAMAARLDALLGRDATAAVPPLELPEPAGELPAPDSLVARALKGRPALRAGAERVAAAEASLSGARRELFPDLQLGWAYNWSFSLKNSQNFMFAVNLPIFAPWRQLPMRREAAAMRDMSRAELLNLRNETVAKIIETRARAEQDRNLARLYQTSIVPQARTAVQASLASYRVGRLSFMELIDNQMTVNRYETETYRLVADYQQALGELEALVGGPVED